VWFAGSHGNVGGGYDDQEMANVTLAWMMDQLASVGLEFDEESVDSYYDQNRQYYMKLHNSHSQTLFSREPKQWAVSNLYNKYNPVRPWGFGMVNNGLTSYYLLSGKTIRTPGQYRRPDPSSGYPSGPRMTRTNERIHSSIRLRLQLGGLDLDDDGPYKNTALSKWRLRQMKVKVQDPIDPKADWADLPKDAPVPHVGDVRWVWEWNGPQDENAPLEPIMIEDVPGPFERRLLLLNNGLSDMVIPSFGGAVTHINEDSL